MKEDDEQELVPEGDEQELVPVTRGPIRVNWPAFWVTVFFLVVTGMLLGRLSAAPGGQTIECPSRAGVQIVRSDDHVVAYCTD